MLVEKATQDQSLLEVLHKVTIKNEMSVRGCDASCSQHHFTDGACLICGQDYGLHLGHQCKAASNAGSRGSWTTNIPKDLISKKGCDASCSQAHYTDGACLICGQDYGLHLGHECKAASNAGSRGSWTTSIPKLVQVDLTNHKIAVPAVNLLQNGFEVENCGLQLTFPCGPVTVLSDCQLQINSSKPIAWTFMVTGNRSWCMGLVPEKYVSSGEYLHRSGVVGLNSMHTGGGNLPRKDMHGKIVTVAADASTRTATFFIDGHELPSSALQTDLFPLRLGVCGFNGTIINFLSESSKKGNDGNSHSLHHNRCMVCTQCFACTGFGNSCMHHKSRDRSGDKGKECGCGAGKSGCRSCGRCDSCCRTQPICSGELLQAFHTGLMICRCLHDIGQKPFPLDATYFHSPLCKWACCNQDWSITACTAAANSTQSNSSKEAKFSESPEWQWRNENGNWIAYSPTDMNKIEKAFKDNIDEVLRISGKTYHINTKALIQTNVDNGTTKTIRRVLEPESGEEFEWRWLREDGQWIPYSLILQKQIEDVFTRNDQDTYTFEKDGRRYCINTAQLIQTNVSSGTTKSIQRIAKGDVPIEMSLSLRNVSKKFISILQVGDSLMKIRS